MQSAGRRMLHRPRHLAMQAPTQGAGSHLLTSPRGLSRIRGTPRRSRRRLRRQETTTGRRRFLSHPLAAAVRLRWLPRRSGRRRVPALRARRTQRSRRTQRTQRLRVLIVTQVIVLATVLVTVLLMDLAAARNTAPSALPRPRADGGRGPRPGPASGPVRCTVWPGRRPLVPWMRCPQGVRAAGRTGRGQTPRLPRLRRFQRRRRLPRTRLHCLRLLSSLTCLALAAVRERGASVALAVPPTAVLMTVRTSALTMAFLTSVLATVLVAVLTAALAAVLVLVLTPLLTPLLLAQTVVPRVAPGATPTSRAALVPWSTTPLPGSVPGTTTGARSPIFLRTSRTGCATRWSVRTSPRRRRWRNLLPAPGPGRGARRASQEALCHRGRRLPGSLGRDPTVITTVTPSRAFLRTWSAS